MDTHPDGYAEPTHLFFEWRTILDRFYDDTITLSPLESVLAFVAGRIPT